MDVLQWRRSARLSITEGALSTAMGTLLSGVFLTGFALSLGAGPLQIGVLAALPPLASVAQLLGARIINAGINRKRFCIWSIAASRLAWAAVLAIPLVAAVSQRWAIGALITVVAASSVLGSLGGVASLSWIRDLVPHEKRFGFLGLRNQINTVLALALSFAGAAFLDWWGGNFADTHGGFQFVLAAAILCGLAAIPVLKLLEDPAQTRVLPSANSSVHFPLRERNFRNLVMFYTCWNLANSLAAPFFAVVMFMQLGLPFWQITSLQTLASIAGLGATQMWTSLGERIGARRVVFIATLGDAFVPLCWLFVSPEATWALPLIFLFGVFNAPLAIGGQTLVMNMASSERAPSYLATFNAIIGIVMAIAAISGGYIANSTHQLAIGDAAWSGLGVVFIASFVGRLASLTLLSRVTMPEPAPQGSQVSTTVAPAMASWSS